MWYVYILECANEDLYTGMTNNISRRLEEHKQGKGGYFTKSIGVNKLVYNESYLTKHDAVKREAQIKGWTRKKKQALIEGKLDLLKKL